MKKIFLLFTVLYCSQAFSNDYVTDMLCINENQGESGDAYVNGEVVPYWSNGLKKLRIKFNTLLDDGTFKYAEVDPMEDTYDRRTYGLYKFERKAASRRQEMWIGRRIMEKRRLEYFIGFNESEMTLIYTEIDIGYQSKMHSGTFSETHYSCHKL